MTCKGYFNEKNVNLHWNFGRLQKRIQSAFYIFHTQNTTFLLLFFSRCHYNDKGTLCMKVDQAECAKTIKKENGVAFYKTP